MQPSPGVCPQGLSSPQLSLSPHNGGSGSEGVTLTVGWQLVVGPRAGMARCGLRAAECTGLWLCCEPAQQAVWDKRSASANTQTSWCPDGVPEPQDLSGSVMPSQRL